MPPEPTTDDTPPDAGNTNRAVPRKRPGRRLLRTGQLSRSAYIVAAWPSCRIDAGAVRASGRQHHPRLDSCRSRSSLNAGGKTVLGDSPQRLRKGRDAPCRRQRRNCIRRRVVVTRRNKLYRPTLRGRTGRANGDRNELVAGHGRIGATACNTGKGRDRQQSATKSLHGSTPWKRPGSAEERYEERTLLAHFRRRPTRKLSFSIKQIRRQAQLPDRVTQNPTA
jgi:hypothetical protein